MVSEVKVCNVKVEVEELGGNVFDEGVEGKEEEEAKKPESGRGHRRHEKKMIYLLPKTQVGLSTDGSCSKPNPSRDEVVLPLLHGQADFHPNFLISGTNSFCTFTFNLTVFLLVMKIIALTMNVTGVIKDQLLMAFSWSIIRDTITLINLFGYDVAFLG
ncbi:hypothetical protein ZIOFF_067701 [Zingiber officinale]|uniref:Uncharacterized protein n=1 Tax=Zingiber officinale TaxID=94328 RepID=A0A8J5CE81_ZINOF|nr:hypothetical protein ZIOFF_067701 [Zingiber officinale]